MVTVEPKDIARDPVEVAGPLGTPLGLAQRKRASPRGEAGCHSEEEPVSPWRDSWNQNENRGHGQQCPPHGLGARVTAGPKRPHLGVCPGPNIPLQGRQGSRAPFAGKVTGLVCGFLKGRENQGGPSRA